MVRTVWIERESDKKLTGKKAGQLLANNFPAFDRLGVRNGLTTAEKGWRAMRTINPTEKCIFHYVWEIAYVNEEPSE